MRHRTPRPARIVPCWPPVGPLGEPLSDCGAEPAERHHAAGAPPAHPVHDVVRQALDAIGAPDPDPPRSCDDTPPLSDDQLD